MSLETLFEKYGLLNCEANVFLVLEKPGDFTDDQLEQRILELGDCLAQAYVAPPSEGDERRAAQKKYADYVRGLKRQSDESQEAYLARLRRESRREMHRGLERAAEGVKPLKSMTISELREKVRADAAKPDPGWPTLPHQHRHSITGEAITLDAEGLRSLLYSRRPDDELEVRRMKNKYGHAQLDQRLTGRN